MSRPSHPCRRLSTILGGAVAAILLLLAPVLVVRGQSTVPPGADARSRALWDEAEALRVEGSYARALEVYERLGALDLSREEALWLRLRRADVTWRAQAVGGSPDSGTMERARQELVTLLEDLAPGWSTIPLRAAAHESLGDSWWRPLQQDWGAAWRHYEEALDAWAGSRSVEEARRHYLDLVWAVAALEGGPDRPLGYGGHLPPESLESALELAVDPVDRARMSFLLAWTLRWQSGDEWRRRRVERLFESAIDGGPETGIHDAALYHFGEWLVSWGRPRWVDGRYVQEQDFGKALEVFERLILEYASGESAYLRQAREQIRSITAPSLTLTVDRVFLPGTEVVADLHWRNVRDVELVLHRLSLDSRMELQPGRSAGEWPTTVDADRLSIARSWTRPSGDRGDHVPGQTRLRLGRELEPGAYLLVARGNSEEARQLVLVSDATLVLKVAPDSALVYVCDAMSGHPLPGARVQLYRQVHDGRQWSWTVHTGRTDEDGLLRLALPAVQQSREILVLATAGDRPVVAQTWAGGSERPESAWRLYAFPDRPAYRPGEEVGWKVLARRRGEGGFETPAGGTLEYEILDPRGAKVDAGILELDDFGGAFSKLGLGEQLALGEYVVVFRTAGQAVGSATLFRLEEYRLPEFEVRTTLAGVDSGSSARLGEPVNVRIEAEYYFGGPVAGATVELLIYQRPHIVWWEPPTPYHWLRTDRRGSGVRPFRGGAEQLVRREELVADAQGRVELRLETPSGSSQDLLYRAEARVRDQARREVVGSGSLPVTRQSTFVHLRARHRLYRPGEQASVDVKVLDATGAGKAGITGDVVVTRQWWWEVWLDPDGREVSGEELESRRRRLPIFPPAGARPLGWRLVSRGYRSEEVERTSLTSDGQGEAELVFAVEREGYYRVEWSSHDPSGVEVGAETAMWAGDRSTRDLGYREGELEIVVDRDLAHAGASTPVMISAPGGGRSVLLSVEADSLLDVRLLRLDGSVRFIELPLDARHVPNVVLGAVMVRGLEIHGAEQMLTVPATDRVFDVRITPESEEVRPGQESSLLLTARDADGKPVEAQLALALVDEAVFAIQDDLAGDIRQVFYGEQRSHLVRTWSSLYERPFSRLTEDEGGELVEVRAEGLADADGGEGAAWWVGGESEIQFRGGPVRGVGALARFDSAKPMAQAAAPAPPAEFAKLSEASAEGGDQVAVRTDFRSTVVWLPDVRTDAAGRASVAVRYPDSLTRWKATARGATRGDRFGQGEATVRTLQPLMVRLQTPRFLVAGDEAVVSAVVNNLSEEAVQVTAVLTVEGSLSVLSVRTPETEAASYAATVGPRFASPPLRIPASGELRVDWRVAAHSPGEISLTAETRARAAERADLVDAMESRLEVFAHGVPKRVAAAAMLRDRSEETLFVDVPAERQPHSTVFTVQVAPSLAVTMLDALPYLLHYPYGCTEQTLSRFLPAVVVARTLEDLGLDRRRRELAMSRVFGGIEAATAEQTHPDGRLSLEELATVVERGLVRLYDMQHEDGGWGWWKEGPSDPYMTAYALWGLSLALRADIRVEGVALERAASFLRERLAEAGDPDLTAWMLHAVAVYHGSREPGAGQLPLSRLTVGSVERLWQERDRLTAFGRALYALALVELDRGGEAAERLQVLARNLENGAVIDRRRGELDTAHWGSSMLSWRWSEGAVESTAFVLRALLVVAPESELVHAAGNWLVENRRGAQWSNTRDTAISVLALSDYLKVTGELEREVSFDLFVNDRLVARRELEGEDLLAAPQRFEVGEVRDGRNRVRLVRRSGDGPLYFAAAVDLVSLEEPVTPAASGLSLERRYRRFTPHPTLLRGVSYDLAPLVDGGSTASGDRVEVVVEVEARNDAEYIVLEDLKPAGLEAVELRSGGPLYARRLRPEAPPLSERDSADDSVYTGDARFVYRELRDRQVALFLDRLPQGRWEIRYSLRAETPGRFHALPVIGHAMYVPEIRGNGSELRLGVED